MNRHYDLFLKRNDNWVSGDFQVHISNVIRTNIDAIVKKRGRPHTPYEKMSA